MHFYEALKFILSVSAGSRISRKAWDNRNIDNEKRFVCKGYEFGKYVILFKYITDHEEKYQHYTPSQEDMTADDWYVVTEV